MTNTLFIFLILEKIIVLQSYPILHHRLVPNKPVKNHRYLYRNHIHSGKEYTKSKILLLPFQLAYTPQPEITSFNKNSEGTSNSSGSVPAKFC